jgi:ParB-like chromosome segregation protein Spo0J
MRGFRQGGALAYDDAVADEALRESMRAVGYLPGLPVVKDEYATVIVGHRRDRIARELGLEAETITIPFGDGSDADAQRARQAYWSNIGGRPFPADARQPISVHMVIELGWSQEAAAGVLGVSQKTISRDLAAAEAKSSADAAQRAATESQAKEGGTRKRASGGGAPSRPREATLVKVINAAREASGDWDINYLVTHTGLSAKTAESAVTYLLIRNNLAKGVKRGSYRLPSGMEEALAQRDAARAESASTITEDVLAVLNAEHFDPPGMAYLRDRLPRWTPTELKTALAELEADGTIENDGHGHWTKATRDAVVQPAATELGKPHDGAEDQPGPYSAKWQKVLDRRAEDREAMRPDIEGMGGAVVEEYHRTPTDPVLRLLTELTALHIPADEDLHGMAPAVAASLADSWTSPSAGCSSFSR